MYPKSKSEILTYLFIFTLAVMGLYFAHTDLLYFEGTFVREDGIIEWLTFFALLFSAFASFYRIYILKPFRTTIFTIGLLCTGLFFLFGAGEEISWGQRIFDFHSPSFFIQYNTQQEFNIHNLRFGGFKINRYIFGTFLGVCVASYFFILPIFYRKSKKVKNLIDSLALPLPNYYHIFFYVLIFIISVLIKKSPSGKSGEILEFGGSWICMLLILNPLNRPIFSRKSLER